MTFDQKIIHCELCPRLRNWCTQISQEKTKRFQDETYWGKPVPSFGSLHSAFLIVGLAPAAHGANRTGRMFTGDRSGQWLYRALHKAGFANQATYEKKKDGLKLHDCRITAVVRCAPPLNKPTTEERNTCLPFLSQEISRMKNLKVILCLGQFGWSGTLLALQKLGITYDKKPTFGHGAIAQTGPYHLIGSYHPSQQNTFTGRLTESMFDEVFAQVKQCL